MKKLILAMFLVLAMSGVAAASEFYTSSTFPPGLLLTKLIAQRAVVGLDQVMVSASVIYVPKTPE